MNTERILNNFKYEDESGTELFPSGKLFRISYDAKTNRMRLRCFNRNDLDDISEVFSDKNPASFFMRQYGYNINQKLYMINNFGYFPIGLVFEILKYIKIRYGSLNILAVSENCKSFIREKITPLKNKILKDGAFLISNISDDSGRNDELERNGKNRFEYRYYQKSAIEELLFTGMGRGIVDLPTASGKSFFLCNFIYNIMKNVSLDYTTLLLVPNKQLVSQMYNDFIDYGMDEKLITKFTAGLKKNEKFDNTRKIIIANRQYVFKNTDMLPKVDILICDEVHQCLAEVTKNFISELDCGIKIGCSGSIPRDKYNRWQLIGMFGNIVYKESIVDLQDKGFISKLKLHQINIIDTIVENNRNYLFNLRPFKRYSPDENGYSEIPFNAAHEAEHEYYDKHYMELYKPALEYVSKFDENTLILFDRIEIGKGLFESASEIFKGKTIHYIDGSVPVQKRLEITQEFENSGNNVLFAENMTFSTGINIKRLTNVMFLVGGKSLPFLLQSVGRTLRLHQTKSEARIFNVSFNFKYSQRHLLERLKIFKSEYRKSPDVTVKLKI